MVTVFHNSQNWSCLSGEPTYVNCNLAGAWSHTATRTLWVFLCKDLHTNFILQAQFKRQLFFFSSPPCQSSGADPCACLPPDTQPSPTGHPADRGGAGPHCPAHRTHPAPTEGRVRPRTGWLWEEDQRVSRKLWVASLAVEVIFF